MGNKKSTKTEKTSKKLARVMREQFMKWLKSEKCPLRIKDAKREVDKETGDNSEIFEWNSKGSHILFSIDKDGYIDMQFNTDGWGKKSDGTKRYGVGLEFMITLDSEVTERVARKVFCAYVTIYKQAIKNRLTFTDYDSVMDDMEDDDNKLRKAFDRVCDKKDWKKPVNAWIPKKDFNLVNDAIIFMTSTPAEIVAKKGSKVKIHADGYRAGPAGDR